MGEDVAALGVGAELDLVDGEEIDLAIKRHRLDRADEVTRPERDDLFFAGDQRDLGRAPGLDYPIVDLAREQPQRQADHPRGVAQHPLHRQMGLPGIGRPEDGYEPRGVAPRWRAVHAHQCGGCRRAPQASPSARRSGLSRRARLLFLDPGRAAGTIESRGRLAEALHGQFIDGDDPHTEEARAKGWPRSSKGAELEAMDPAAAGATLAVQRRRRQPWSQRSSPQMGGTSHVLRTDRRDGLRRPRQALQ